MKIEDLQITAAWKADVPIDRADGHRRPSRWSEARVSREATVKEAGMASITIKRADWMEARA
jgi:hypothetical protein